MNYKNKLLITSIGVIGVICSNAICYKLMYNKGKEVAYKQINNELEQIINRHTPIEPVDVDGINNLFQEWDKL